MNKKFTLAVFLIIILSNFSKAYSIEADVFVQSTVNRAANTLGGNLSKEERIVKLKEIAVIMDLSESNAKVKMHRTLNKLRKHLKEK